ncbi:cyclophilin-like protein, partial [Tilletiaria anomala UBC 951]
MNVDPLQTEPPTTGKIKLRTSMGDVTIALWSKEAPLACRNIVQLALEGYYEDQIFHRILPGFIVQTGDPTGTGRGGSSIFESEDNPEGEFKDEHHHRLKMTKRGLVAMANAGRPHSNESQFFITLGPTPELQGRHTIFGKVEGPGIYTILSISEVELEDKEVGRPRHPPKLLGIDVIQNPFDDIVPRIT